MSNRRTTKRDGTSKRRRPRRHLLIFYSLLICAGIGLLVLGQGVFVEQANIRPSDDSAPPTAISSKTRAIPPARKSTKPESAADQIALIDNDGQTLWASPTDGAPLDVGYLSSGAQIIVAMRPKAILLHSEGGKLLRALGPAGERGITWLEENIPMHLAEMERLVIGYQATSEGKWLMTFVIQRPQPVSLDPISKLESAKDRKYEGQTYVEINDRAYYLPNDKNGNVLVVAPAPAMADIIELAGEAPPLRRDLERLLAHTDAERHITVVVTPNSLFSEGRSMFAGEMTGLREPLFWFLGDELSAAAFSMHWDENFFFELIATPTLDTTPERAARILAERMRQIPDKLTDYVAGLSAQPYGREVVARFPAMVRTMVDYTRSGFEPDHAVLRGYLPAVAGHNLLMGAELTLAESPGAARTVAEATAPSEPRATKVESVQERLRRPASLRFARDTLEAALEQLANDIGVEIVIRGPDLQADGITKNQSFGIGMENKPAEEILVEILRLANPDKTATGPSHPRQKLVYVIASGENGSEEIVITTRAAAATRGDKLPTAFQAASP